MTLAVFYHKGVVYNRNLHLVAGFKTRLLQPQAAQVQPGHFPGAIKSILPGLVLALQFDPARGCLVHVEKI
jgi:hypothetical protein